MENSKDIAIVLAHGMGNQKRYDFLKSFVEPFRSAVDEMEAGSSVRIDKVELNRLSVRSRETSDLFGFFGDGARATNEMKRSLFCPVAIDRAGAGSIRIYEAYWADEDMSYSWIEKIRFELWLLGTVLNPLFRRGLYVDPAWKLFATWLSIVGTLLAYHTAELGLVCLSIVLGKPKWLDRFGQFIYEYAGDIRLYFGEIGMFYRQTKAEVLRNRFDETMIKACRECDEVYVVAHSLGSAVAFDCLLKHDIGPSTMSEELLGWLVDKVLEQDRCRYSPFEKLRGLITLGSPLEKTRLFFASGNPATDSGEPMGPVEIHRKPGPNTDDRAAWTATRIEGAKANLDNFHWWNISDFADPVGSRITLSEGTGRLGRLLPENLTIARRWLPSAAHTELFTQPDLMRWLAGTVLGRPTELPREASPGAKSARLAVGAVMSAVALLSLSLVFFFALDLGLGTLNDLIMDAESRTIFAQTHELAGLATNLRAGMQLHGQGGFHMAVRGLEIAARFTGAGMTVALIWKTVARIRKGRA